MTSPPQPQRKPLLVDDLDLGVSGNQIQAATGKRAAANQRQREKAAEEADYERWRLAMVEQNWGKQ